MNRTMRALSTFVMAGSLAVASLVAAGPASAGQAQATALACSLGADRPKPGANGSVVGVGSRSGCGSSRVTLTVRVKKKRFGRPDVTVGLRTHARFGNGIMTVIAGCDGNAKYYTETVSSSGNKVKSTARELC